MAKRVVNTFEMVDVEENDRDRLPGSRTSAQFRSNNAVEMSTVPGARQTIDRTEPLQLDNSLAQLVQLIVGHANREFIDNQHNAVLDSGRLRLRVELASLPARQPYPMPGLVWIANDAAQLA
jgi:hypothetical protein